MDSLALFCTASLVAGGVYWFVFLLGAAERKGKRAVHLSGGSISGDKVRDNYKQYCRSTSRRPWPGSRTEMPRAHSGANVVGITINEYQVNRAHLHNKKAGLESQCEVVCGNFLEMPFPDNSFDGAYSIEATCHAPKLEEVYSEIFRVLKPGSMYVSYEWNCVLEEPYTGNSAWLVGDCSERGC
ncbi:unnamed protein product, partial [Vitis vinifera]